jgi:hypothetical protein
VKAAFAGKRQQAGVLQKDDEGRIEFPYTAVHVDFMLKTAA